MSQELPFYQGSFVISEDRMIYNEFHQYFRNLAQLYSDEFESRLLKNFKHIDDFINDGYAFGECIIIQSCKDTVTRLINDFSIYDVSTERLFSSYSQTSYYKWFETFVSVLDGYMDITLDQAQKRNYRSLRKDLRGRFIGGGLGFEGAAKGIVAAETLNLGTGLLHGVFNGMGNFFTSIATEGKKQKLYKTAKKELKNAVFQSVINVRFAYIGILEDRLGLEITGAPTAADKEQADSILENLRTIQIESERKLDLLKRALELYPYNIEPYLQLIDLFGDSDLYVQTLSNVFGLGTHVENYKELRIKRIYDNRKKENAKQFQSLKHELLWEANRLGVNPEESTWYQQVEEQLQQMSIESRTVSLIGMEYVFASEQTASSAKGFQKRIFENIVTEKRAHSLVEELDHLSVENDQEWNRFRTNMKAAVSYVLDVHTALGLNSYDLPQRLWDGIKEMLLSGLRGYGANMRTKASGLLAEVPGFASPHFAYAWSYVIDGDYRNALAHLEKAIALAPDCAYYYFYKAYVFQLMGQDNSEWIEKSLEVLPSCADSLTLKANGLYKNGNDKAALDLSDLALSVSPSTIGADNFLVIAKLKEKQGEDHKKYHQYSQAVKEQGLKASLGPVTLPFLENASYDYRNEISEKVVTGENLKKPVGQKSEQAKDSTPDFGKYGLERYQTSTKNFGNRFYVYSSASHANHLKNAVNAFMKDYYTEDQQVIFIYDDTMLGGGQKGFAITDKYFYSSAGPKIPIQDVSAYVKENAMHVNNLRVSVPFIRNKEDFSKFISSMFKGYRDYCEDFLASQMPNTGLGKHIDEKLVAFQKKLLGNASVSAGSLTARHQKGIQSLLDQVNKEKKSPVTFESGDILACYREFSPKEARGLAIAYSNQVLYLITLLEGCNVVLELKDLKTQPAVKGLFKKKLVIEVNGSGTYSGEINKSNGLMVFLDVVSFLKGNL